MDKKTALSSAVFFVFNLQVSFPFLTSSKLRLNAPETFQVSALIWHGIVTLCQP